MSKSIIVKSPQELNERGYSPLTKAYHKWLTPFINPTGYGLKWKGHPIHCNKRERILASKNGIYFDEFNRKQYLQRLTKKKLQNHGQSGTIFYFTGSRSGKSTMVMLDIDCHNQEPDGLRFIQHLLGYFPGGFWQPSTNNRGYHLYLILDTQGLHPKLVNLLFAKLQMWLNREAEKGDFIISGAEVKGNIQHEDNDEGWYCGTLGKVPIVQSFEELERLKATYGISARALLDFLLEHKQNLSVSPSASSERKKEEDIQKYLVVHKRQRNCDKSSSEGGLRQVSTCKDLSILAGTPGTTRRYLALLILFNSLARRPTDEEAMEFLRLHEIYTPPWEQNLTKRLKDVQIVLDKIERIWNPTKATVNYGGFARGLLEGHTVTYGGKRKVHWQDVAIFLDIVHVAVIQQPNADGSVPYERIRSLWDEIAKRRRYRRPWHNLKNKTIRDCLVACGVIQMVDEDYRTGKAMRWTIGPAHPAYGKVRRVILLRADSVWLRDGYLMEKLAATG